MSSKSSQCDRSTTASISSSRSGRAKAATGTSVLAGGATHRNSAPAPPARWEVLQIGDKRGRLYHIPEGRIRAREGPAQVCEHLLRLSLEIPDSHHPSGAVEPHLAGDLGGTPVGTNHDVSVPVGGVSPGGLMNCRPGVWACTADAGATSSRAHRPAREPFSSGFITASP